MADPLALSTDCEISISQIGAERQPVLQLDGFLANPQAVREIATRAKFAPIGPYYPGIRSAIPAAALAPIMQALGPALIDCFALPSAPQLFESFLSLVTTPADQLAPIQRLPHFDGLDPNALALLLYLDPNRETGTAFYRQHGTDFETVDALRLDAYRAQLQADLATHGMPAAAYIGDGGGLFAKVHAIAGQFNRAIVYRSNSLHCAALPAGFLGSANAAEGRLTLNLFLR